MTNCIVRSRRHIVEIVMHFAKWVGTAYIFVIRKNNRKLFQVTVANVIKTKTCSMQNVVIFIATQLAMSRKSNDSDFSHRIY